MKKLLLLLPFLASASVYAQCNAGYESPTFANTVNTPANTIFTITVTASSAGTLTGISFYNTGTSTANIKCCVYDDAAGIPANLIASTSAYQVTGTPGPVTLTVTPVFIPAGTYHVGAVIDMNSSVVPIDNSTSATLYAYPSTFSNPFPPSGSSFITTNGNPVNIWMNITCSASGVQENNANSSFSMNCFPSPANDQFTMHFVSAVEKEINVQFYNSAGQLMIEQKTAILSGENSLSMGVGSFASGIYFIRVSDAGGVLLASQKMIRE